MSRLLLALLLALEAVACGGDSNGVTAPSTTASTPVTEVFTGPLAPSGSAFYSFTVTTAGVVTVTLASTATVRIGPAVSVPLRIGVGTPSGFGCAVSQESVVSPALSAQLTTASLPAGIYCVNVADAGAMPGDVTFVVRLVHT